MIRVPGEKPHVPPPITPKEAGKEVKKAEEGPRPAAPAKPGIGRGPEMDARAIAVRLAALATEAKEKEIAAEEFERILEEVIKLTGLKQPQAAMEEANRRLQKEIELELEKIKANKELMEEAEDWQKFAELLSKMNAEQVEALLGLLKQEVKAL
ncbi:hypothetical protein AMJ44_03985 [candidate division WOR-1 bacterium DG_54_3]|uniref:Uncharacterized protein n=1 Tax=candidate division WOR-1 bacterium DG_54_3 TaxID=1703775 RepID=A0A0S7Y3R3_UNCSA|nr:MAG: hypothetical protein AMJ44_03985 [candidate division WOR-1 bacterium DG_54_3]